jgi:hypothetical protein
MEVKFRPAAEDYRSFYRYHSFSRNLGLKIAVIALFSSWVGGGYVGRPFSLGPYLLDSLAICGILLFSSTVGAYLVALIRTRKSLKQLEAAAPHWRIELTGDGILVQRVVESEPEKEKKFWRWGAIKYTGASSKCVFIVLKQGPVFVIPKSAFHSAELADHFVFILEAGTEKVQGRKSDRAKKLYLWGLLGLIPNVGVIAGLILLFKGIFQFRDKILIVIGAADILFTVLFWWIFTSALSTSGAFKSLNAGMARTELNTVFRCVEFYKVEHGVYPDSLQQIDPQRNGVSIFDPLQPWGADHQVRYFYYQKVGEKYWLFSVGLDGKPFTSDDIFPVMNPADTGKFGLMIK